MARAAEQFKDEGAEDDDEGPPGKFCVSSN